MLNKLYEYINDVKAENKNIGWKTITGAGTKFKPRS